ncbi:Set1 complex component ash2 [Fusarium oxysporum f. sp. albedinis]|nr:Set1 complex component ash2 [Fusarium oxysporum f. sp. albedinis]
MIIQKGKYRLTQEGERVLLTGITGHREEDDIHSPIDPFFRRPPFILDALLAWRSGPSLIEHLGPKASGK